MAIDRLNLMFDLIWTPFRGQDAQWSITGMSVLQHGNCVVCKACVVRRVGLQVQYNGRDCYICR